MNANCHPKLSNIGAAGAKGLEFVDWGTVSIFQLYADEGAGARRQLSAPRGGGRGGGEGYPRVARGLPGRDLALYNVLARSCRRFF